MTDYQPNYRESLLQNDERKYDEEESKQHQTDEPNIKDIEAGLQKKTPLKEKQDDDSQNQQAEEEFQVCPACG